MPLVNPQRMTVQRFTTGSGTYTTPAGTRYIIVQMCGAGGGGGGSGNSTAGTSGTNTTFGSSLLTGGPGEGGSSASASNYGGAGGTITVSAPAVQILAQTGGRGNIGFTGTTGVPYQASGSGGSSLGPGGPSVYNVAGLTPDATSYGGGGSGGGGAVAIINAGHGGGGGGFLTALISSPSATYAYAIGAGGAGAAAGVSGFAGGTGAGGIVIVQEFY